MTSIAGGIIGHYCCSNGDTWSSELGVLSDEQPRLITNFKVGYALLWSLVSFIFSKCFYFLPHFPCISSILFYIGCVSCIVWFDYLICNYTLLYVRVCLMIDLGNFMSILEISRIQEIWCIYYVYYFPVSYPFVCFTSQFGKVLMVVWQRQDFLQLPLQAVYLGLFLLSWDFSLLSATST